MRIAYLAPTFPPYPGGMGMNAYYNALEISKRGFDVEVFTPRYRPLTQPSPLRGEDKGEGCAIHYLCPLFSYGNAAFLPQLFWRLRHFDIVHIYYPFFGAVEVAALARYFFKFKLILHHEMDVVGEGMLKKFFSWHGRYILPWLLKKTDLLFVLSEDYFQNSDFGRLYSSFSPPPVGGVRGGGILPPWRVMPNGVDVELFKPIEFVIPSDQREPRDLTSPINNGVRSLADARDDEERIILFVAGLDKAHYFKGVPVLLQAMAILKKENFSAKLLLAGEGDLKNEYEKQAHELGLDDRVEFVGLLTHDALPAFYARGSLSVMPSVGRTESFSISTAEAQACGLPAIVSNLPGMRVTIEDGVTGFLVRPGDVSDLAEKIKKILQNPELARQMGQAGRERMEKLFSWNGIGEKLEKIYIALIKN